MHGLLLAAILAANPSVVPAQSQATVKAETDFDAQGYRARRYRAPVDRAPAPARQITLRNALRLPRALFIDVLPVEGGYRDAVTGIWRLSQSHATIPGALWHPETGRAVPDPLLWRGLENAVAAARRKHPNVPVVVFCRSDCWMGWNAARRLARSKVRRVYWLAEGIDGWNAAGRALVDVQPVAIKK